MFFPFLFDYFLRACHSLSSVWLQNSASQSWNSIQQKRDHEASETRRLPPLWHSCDSALACWHSVKGLQPFKLGSFFVILLIYFSLVFFFCEEETALGPEPASCTRFSHLKSGRCWLPPGQASERLASAHALTPLLAPSTPLPPLRSPSQKPLFSGHFSSHRPFPRGLTLLSLSKPSHSSRKITPPRGAPGSCLPLCSTSASFDISLLPLANKRGGKPTSQRSQLVSGFSLPLLRHPPEVIGMPFVRLWTLRASLSPVLSVFNELKRSGCY